MHLATAHNSCVEYTSFITVKHDSLDMRTSRKNPAATTHTHTHTHIHTHTERERERERERAMKLS